MNVSALRSIQAPLKDFYRKHPEQARITLIAEGALGNDVTCSVATGKGLVNAGLHPATGGDGISICSGDMLLQALVACAGVTLNAVATALDIDVHEGVVRAEGDLDFRGTLGVEKTVAVGFSDIRLMFTLVSETTDEQLKTLLKLTERYCVVYQTLLGNPTVTARISATEINKKQYNAALEPND